MPITNVNSFVLCKFPDFAWPFYWLIYASFTQVPSHNPIGRRDTDFTSCRAKIQIGLAACITNKNNPIYIFNRYELCKGHLTFDKLNKRYKETLNIF